MQKCGVQKAKKRKITIHYPAFYAAPCFDPTDNQVKRSLAIRIEMTK